MRIFIAAGGSGGHLFPAVRLAEEINAKRRAGIIFITSSREQDRVTLTERRMVFKTLPVIGFKSKNIFHVLNFALRLGVSAIISLCLLLRFRPSAVVGFGGYVSGPILFTAALFRVKTIIHEQNVYPGKANRILARFVDRVAVSFPESIKYLQRFRSKVILSGNPLRRGLKQVCNTGDSFRVLAMGGSQGARSLNKLIPAAVALIEDDKKKLLEIIHISGHGEEGAVIEAYGDKGVENTVFTFNPDMDELYNKCDFVISRAGATTVSELLFTAKPSILIPYPHGDGHQFFNAKILADMGSSILLKENGLTAETLRDHMVRLMNRKLLGEMFNSVKDRHNKDACDILIKEIFD